jgi:hypothetical protein
MGDRIRESRGGLDAFVLHPDELSDGHHRIGEFEEIPGIVDEYYPSGSIEKSISAAPGEREIIREAGAFNTAFLPVVSLASTARYGSRPTSFSAKRPGRGHPLPAHRR